MELAGSAVGFVSLGLQVCQGLLSYYNDWKDYRTDIRSVYESITDLSRTLGLLRTSLGDELLDKERAERVKNCLIPCEYALNELSLKQRELQKYPQPERSRQKTWSEVQRLAYPFKKDTLKKLQETVGQVQERLKLAIQILQLDLDTNSQRKLGHVLDVSQQNQRLLGVQQSDHFQNVKIWLAPPDPWTNHQSARQRHEPQTGTWLLQSDLYQKWKDGAVKHLWISGKAGCGKTILSSTAIEDVQEYCTGKESVGYAIFYFSFSDNRKQAFKDLICSLVAQLGWKEPGASMLQQAYEKPNRSTPSEDELERILVASVKSFDEVFLILDALDESPEGGEVRQTTLDGIERLAQSAPNIKILATSRELRDVRESMETIEVAPISVATSTVDEDIRRYVTTQLHDRKFARLNARTRSLIEETISRKADGMFRWAYCQLQELKKLKSAKPKYIEDALRDLPATLDETYERMLVGIEKRYHAEALTLLQWLAYAQSPPTLGELAEAAIIDPMEENEVDTGNRGDIEDTLDILGGLVTVLDCSEDHDDIASDDSMSVESDSLSISSSSGRVDCRYTDETKVRLAHFSVQEYLESERIQEGEAKNFSLKSTRGHRFLAQSCLSYISHYCCESAKSLTKNDFRAYPLLRYSAKSWYYHSSRQECADVSREVSLLSSITSKHNWLLVHQPDRLWAYPFEEFRDVGSSLYYAGLVGLQRVIQMLLDAGADVNAEGGHYGNALQAASLEGHTEVVQLLLDSGANVNAEGGHYGSALQAAS
ncbi:hypothetical protein K431DRAFT_123484, partial [Polychaeton citri CBS 116435]